MNHRPRLLLRFCAFLLTAVVIMALASCGSSKKTTGKKPKTGPKTEQTGGKKGEQKRNYGNSSYPKHSEALVKEGRKWIGTPYKYGGTTKKGVDCSGFVSQVYLNATGIALPRSSSQQAEYCDKIKTEELCVGDLIFFSSNASPGKVAHVGMYIGDGRMIHASTSKGVIESSLDETYYARHYRHSGRVPAMAKADKKSVSSKSRKEAVKEPRESAEPKNKDTSPVPTPSAVQPQGAENSLPAVPVAPEPQPSTLNSVEPNNVVAEPLMPPTEPTVPKRQLRTSEPATDTETFIIMQLEPPTEVPGQTEVSQERLPAEKPQTILQSSNPQPDSTTANPQSGATTAKTENSVQAVNLENSVQADNSDAKKAEQGAQKPEAVVKNAFKK